MIISFYDKNFKGLANNASLVIDNKSYKLIKRPIDMNEFRCTCEPFEEKIQPTFIVVKNDKGNYIYGALAGIPVLNSRNQTEITATDLKSMLSSEIYIDLFKWTEPVQLTYAEDVIKAFLTRWNEQANHNNIKCVFEMKSQTPLSNFLPDFNTGFKVYNVYEEIQKYLRFYGLYLDTKLDLVNKQVVFIVDKMMKPNKQVNIKLWEYGIKNYGKYVANVNEAQGYYRNKDTDEIQEGVVWILTSSNNITDKENLRDIYPVKRKVILSENNLKEAETQAITRLLDSLFNEDINIGATAQQPFTFETLFSIYTQKGADKYKDLPCGELEYDSTGLKRVKIGFRYSNVSLI